MSDNERDRYAYGYDAGTIVDGVVHLDLSTNKFVLIDDDGEVFDPNAVLQTLMGKKVRITMISFESMEALEKLLANQPKN
jgi:hypothetical protein